MLEYALVCGLLVPYQLKWLIKDSINRRRKS
jgi:hypothetical protein